MQILSIGVMRLSNPGWLARGSLGHIIKYDFSDTNAGLREHVVSTITGLCLLTALSFAPSRSAKVYLWAGDIKNKLERGQ